MVAVAVAPRYPVALREQGVGGEAIMAFVVDTAGGADPSTVRVLHATHPEFVDAARTVLPQMRFVPAQLADGTRVRAFVRMPFRFSVSGPAPRYVPVGQPIISPNPRRNRDVPRVRTEP